MPTKRSALLREAPIPEMQGLLQGEPSPVGGRREAGKAERRRAIIKAARELIRETGNAGLSMRALAARAGVSLATPYNLFGSKRAIVVAMLQDVREFHEQFSAKRPADPIDRIFLALDTAIELYVGDPPFYRTLWTAVFDASEGMREEILGPKGDAFWRGLVDEAAASGALREGVNPNLIGQHLDFIRRSAMFEWAVGLIPAERLAATARLGYAFILAGAVTDDRRQKLFAAVTEAQRRLA
ncbi:MAG: TetR/AcrR family transcriptional regulator [Caulobacteraceae bacterium]|nr:TetR/AcrR family transcriptional regulator [Caulobacteraceae bacterium]